MSWIPKGMKYPTSKLKIEHVTLVFYVTVKSAASKYEYYVWVRQWFHDMKSHKHTILLSVPRDMGNHPVTL